MRWIQPFSPNPADAMIAIDTNIIIRYLTGDDPDQASRARTIIDGQMVFVTVTILLEVEWVLRGAYEYACADIIRGLRALGGLPTVTIEDADAVAAALDLSEQGMDFADALHLTRASHCDGFVTFDRKFVRTARAAGFETIREA